MEYQFSRVDSSETEVALLAAKYKSLRLQALGQSPEAFSSTYEIESQFPDEVWVSRIQTLGKETFVCIDTSEGKAEWVAQVTLRGPLSAEEFQLPEESGQQNSEYDKEAGKWQMLSLYTLPSHRGKGIGKKLCQTAFDFLTSNFYKNDDGIVIRIMVKPDNLVTLGMYKSLGFKQTGLCTLAEALMANGDQDLLPKGELSEKHTTRSGIIMALWLDRNRRSDRK